jgi:CHAT domain-containing protein/predicted negative regulator of RcsB-dependent stress response
MAQALDQRKHGHIAEAFESFTLAAQAAHTAHTPGLEARALNNASGCQILLFQYRQALQYAENALQIALQANENTWAGAAAGNKATVYAQLGDFASAARAADESVTLLRRSPRKDYLAWALLSYGDILGQSGDRRESANAYEESIAVARSAKLADPEASAQEHLGKSLIDADDFAGAEKALSAARAKRLQIHDSDGIVLTNLYLAELAYKKGNYGNGLRLLDEVLRSDSYILSTVPRYWPMQLKGELLVALGRPSEALLSFRQAVTLADSWRQGALPGDATSTRTVVGLHSVYQDYVELAAGLSLKRHDPALARQALEVLAQNRASSLREQMILVLGREMRLPTRYFELLSSLQATQAAVTLGKNSRQLHSNVAKLDRLRLELTDLENEIGVSRENVSQKRESNPHRNSLRDIQLSLTGSQILLSFCLGKDRSFLWAVTGDQVNLYELPAEDKIRAHAKAFSQAVRADSSPVPEALELSRELFGKISPRLAQRAEWLIAADGALLDSVPFCGLPDSSSSEKGAFLIKRHSLRFVPSELLLADARCSQLRKGFVGVADPIYNLADSRRVRGFTLLPVQHMQTNVTLARLVGSEREVRSAAQQSGAPDVRILTGKDASEVNLRSALAKHPEIVHFAVHVVSPEIPNGEDASDFSASGQAALALSLTGDNIPELLTKENIATLRVPGSLVVLSGCSSQQGENLPSAGLVGLSRAWLLAGASAVVVSAWPTPDDSGRFFSNFYRHLQGGGARQANLATRAAAALQQTQLDMQNSSGYRTSPAFWGAYSLISKE